MDATLAVEGNSVDVRGQAIHVDGDTVDRHRVAEVGRPGYAGDGLGIDCKFGKARTHRIRLALERC